MFEMPILRATPATLDFLIDAVNRDVSQEITLKSKINVFREGKNLTSNLDLKSGEHWFRPLVKTLVANSFSLIVNDITLSQPACVELQAITGIPSNWVFQQNLYITPPDVPGFSPHCDVHTVIVVQLFGQKEWFIYNRIEENPVRGQKGQESKISQKITSSDIFRKFLLKTGEIFVIPRGVYHSACAAGVASVHLAIGCAGIRPIDHIWAIAEEALKNPDLRADYNPVDASKLAEDYLKKVTLSELFLPRVEQKKRNYPSPKPKLCFEKELS